MTKRFLLVSLFLPWISFGVINMGSLGDSISAASLANYNLAKPFASSQFAEPMREYSFGSAIFPQFKYLLANYNLSWSTGEEIQSVKGFLDSKTRQKVNTFNLAVPGDKTPDLISRIHEAQLQGTLQKLDVMTLMIGANNVCKEEYYNDPQKAANQLRYSIDFLMSSNQAHLYMTDIPEIYRLYKHKDEVAFLGKTCSEVWNFSYFYCHRLLGNVSPGKLRWVKKQVDSFNDQWDQVAIEMKEKWGSRFHYLPIFRNREFEKQEVSIDCFHPSAIGQETIAKLFTTAMYSGY